MPVAARMRARFLKGDLPMAKAKGGLGKGLDALFADNTTDTQTPTALSIGEIEPNRNQPRKQFEASALSDLADSIREHGVLQPLVVRPMPDGSYQLVAGERRWRAARMAGVNQVPVVIRDLTDKQAMEITLIENLQREDLNPLEEAAGYRELMEHFSLTQEQAAQRVGKSRPVVANALRLLALPQSVQQLLLDSSISSGHARCLLGLDDEEQIMKAAQEIVNRALNVRQAEALVKRLKSEKRDVPREKTAWDNSYYTEAQLALSQSLTRKVQISGDGKKGRIVLEFYGEDDLRALVAALDSGILSHEQ